MKQFCNLSALVLFAACGGLAHAAGTASRLDSPAATTTLQVIDREMIERSGKFSLAEVLRDLPLNSAGSFRPQSASSAQSYAGVDLRGLGEERTLVLVNGRREAIDPSTASASNLNLIPLAMVERIEILPSGAGAIHGMNAMGGVVNIITRDDFRGVEATAGTSWTERAGGEVEGASVLAGIGDNRGSIVVGASLEEREIVFARDRAWSSDGSSIFSNNFLTTAFSFLSDRAANLAGCQGEGFSVEDGLCRYDTALLSADEVATRNESLFANARYRIDGDWALALDARVSRMSAFRPGPPVASSPWLVRGFGAITLEPGTPNHPATRPVDGGLNPFWEDYADLRQDIVLNTHRFAANGAAENSFDAVTYNVSLELQGSLGRFDVALGAHRAEIQHSESIDNLVLTQLAQPAIDRGDYNLYDPFGSPSEVLESFEATGARDANYLLRSFQGTIATDLFELPGGASRILLGAEWRSEALADRPDSLRAAGLVTGSAARQRSGQRDLWAAFGELSLPITERLDGLVAVRLDDYDYAVAGASGRLALEWRALDRLVVHAGWSRSLRAEPLGGQQPGSTFSPDDFLILDPDSCGLPFVPCDFVPVFGVRNPRLDPETLDQIDLGLTYSPFDGMSLYLNAFDVQLDDRFVLIGAQQVLNCLTRTGTRCPDGLRLLDPDVTPPNVDGGLGLAIDDEGDFVYLQTGLASFGRIETRGVDSRLTGRWAVGELAVSSRIEATWVDRYRTDGGADVSGRAGFPDWRGRWQTSADWNDLALTWIVNYIAGQDGALDGSGDLPSWTTHDVQLRWAAPWNADVALGVDNLADRDPVVDNGEAGGFNFALYDGYGRLGYLRYTQRF